MKQTAVIIAPGRGTYNKPELGYLRRHHSDLAHLAEFDAYRASLGQETISALDGAARFSGGKHTRGDNASALIYACAIADFTAINREKYDIIGVTGNSMGWYIALACAGVLSPMAGMQVANTMGTLMQNHMIGGQLIYPFVDEKWCEIPGKRCEIMTEVHSINSRHDHILSLSIDLGGFLVLAGNETGLSAFEAAVPHLDGRFPMRLPNHAGFHTKLQKPVSERGLSSLGKDLFDQPSVSLVDGRGSFWHPKSTDIGDLYQYTLGHQVVETYDFTSAIRTSARELMPDVFIILGPGTTLGGATAQSLVKSSWRGWQSKADFQRSNESFPRVLSMGLQEQRELCV